MFVANQESLDGTLAVVEALKSTPRLTIQEPIRVVPVLSRTTKVLSTDPRFWPGISRLLALAEGCERPSINMPWALPYDDELGPIEKLIGIGRHDRESPLRDAYLKLFQELFPGT
jgi:hypothetical protein